MVYLGTSTFFIYINYLSNISTLLFTFLFGIPIYFYKVETLTI